METWNFSGFFDAIPGFRALSVKTRIIVILNILAVMFL
jgi:hypothetical protein